MRCQKPQGTVIRLLQGYPTSNWWKWGEACQHHHHYFFFYFLISSTLLPSLPPPPPSDNHQFASVRFFLHPSLPLCLDPHRHPGHLQCSREPLVQCARLTVPWPRHLWWSPLTLLQLPGPPYCTTLLNSTRVIFPELCNMMALSRAAQAHGHHLDLVIIPEFLASEMSGSKFLLCFPYSSFPSLSLILLWLH